LPLFLLLLFATAFTGWSMWCALERKPHWWFISLVLYLVFIFGYRHLTGNNFWSLSPFS
jgi:hypothetical protein